MHPLASRRILRSVVVLVLPLLLIGAAASAVLADPAVLDWTDTWGGPGDHNDEATFAFADPGGDGVLVAGTTIRRPDTQ